MLNAYYPLVLLGHTTGGFRAWWRRWHDGSGVDVVDCDRETQTPHRRERAKRPAMRIRWSLSSVSSKHVAGHSVDTGAFLILVARSPATSVGHDPRQEGGHIGTLKKSFCNHYSFHVMDRSSGT